MINFITSHTQVQESTTPQLPLWVLTSAPDKSSAPAGAERIKVEAKFH